ncbi:MAG: prephenate dehydrogenase/arogenate dehydrogenase family protein [Pseudomonadota bacterium]|nr:prephenate dehydrogenase/arogenate dehydrogenase family protein [Pseudomonadota bacterium]
MQKTLVVIGVGLIGGSVAKALRKAWKVEHIIGIGRQRENLAQALDEGVIDEGFTDLLTGVKRADWILVSTPVGKMPGIFSDLARVVSDTCVILDAGSTKQDVVAAGQACLGRHFSRFVPGHPVAGAEISGCIGSRADLFQGKAVVLTPHDNLDKNALEAGRTFWQACGASVSLMDPETHDRIFAAVSHLPHALSFALVEMLAGRSDAEQLFTFAASGFRDFTRIAASSPEMWRDICMANRVELIRVLTQYREQLNVLLDGLSREDAEALFNMFEKAQLARKSWKQERQ